MVSTRRSQPDNKSSYSVGDKVEIVRPGSVDVGILVGKAGDTVGRDSPSSSGSDYSSHWLVSVQGNKGKGGADEESISERYLGRILSGSTDDNCEKEKSEGRIIRRSKKSATGEKGPESPNSRKVSTKATNRNDKGKRKAASNPKAPPKPAAKTTNKTGVEENAYSVPKYGTRATKRQRGDTADLFFEDIEKVMKANKKAKPATPKVGPDESVVEVKMLTGTLYLFRGPKRRAEFVRTV